MMMHSRSQSAVSRTRTVIRDFKTREEGWVSIFAMFFVLSIVAIGSVAVDYSHAEASKTRLKATVDAAALASVWDLPELADVTITSQAYIESNMPNSLFGGIANESDVQVGVWDPENRTFTAGDSAPNAVRVRGHQSVDEAYLNPVTPLLAGLFGFEGYSVHAEAIVTRGIDVCEEQEAPLLAGLSDNLFFFEDGGLDANWQGATKGFAGDVVVNGLVSNERTSGGVPYAGTIWTNSDSADGWQDILDQNPASSAVVTGQSTLVAGLGSSFENEMLDLGSRPATAGFESISSATLDQFSSENGIPETFVINITSGLSLNSPVYVRGDVDDIYILRWDDDLYTEGYQGVVKLSGGGGIIPRGGLTPGNLINLAGGINASGGGSTPAELASYVSQLPESVNGGGFFTGFWLTTGDPDKGYENASLSNGIFVGGWYTSAVKFSMTSGTSGVHAPPAQAIQGAPCKSVAAPTAVLVR